MGLLSRLGRVTARATKDKIKSVVGDNDTPAEDEADAILAAEEAREAARRPVPAAPPPAPPAPPTGPTGAPPPGGRRL